MMLKRFCRWILKEEIFTPEDAMELDERFCNIERKQYDDSKILQRTESLMRNIREDMRILQTRQVNIINQIEAMKP